MSSRCVVLVACLVADSGARAPGGRRVVLGVDRALVVEAQGDGHTSPGLVLHAQVEPSAAARVDVHTVHLLVDSGAPEDI